jgi:hypothetical protein
MRGRAVTTPAAAWRSTRGSIAILIGLMLTLLVGFAALGSEVVYAYYTQTRMEAAASSSAVAGAVALAGGATKARAVLEATAVAATAGFVGGSSGVTVTINNGPASGPYSGLAAYVEVIVGQQLSLPLASVFFSGPWQVNARAVARAGSSGSACVLELDPSGAGAVSLNNGVTITMTGCGMAINSAASPALSVSGGSTLNATGVSIVGSDSISGGGSINPSSGVKTAQPPVANPYSGTAAPSFGACNYTNLTVLGYQNPTLSPGVYCGGISMGSGGTVAMNPGVYYINGGSFSVGGGIAVTGTGVTIVLTGSGSNYATVSIANGTSVTLSAPTTGPTKGLVFYGDPAAPTTNVNTIAGGASLSLTGAMYFPTETVSYSNGSSTNATCTQLVAWRMSFTGGASFNSNCGSAGVSAIGGAPSQLVE